MTAHKKTRAMAGDTIIEVLIAIAIVSSVLAATQNLMNRNLLKTQASQERTEASKVAQGQIEGLRALSVKKATIPDDPFCLNGTSITDLGFNNPIPNLAADTFNTTRYPAPCSSTANFYYIAITRETAVEGGSDGRLYKIHVRWDRIEGGGRDQVEMVYRI